MLNSPKPENTKIPKFLKSLKHQIPLILKTPEISNTQNVKIPKTSKHHNHQNTNPNLKTPKFPNPQNTKVLKRSKSSNRQNTKILKSSNI